MGVSLNRILDAPPHIGVPASEPALRLADQPANQTIPAQQGGAAALKAFEQDLPELIGRRALYIYQKLETASGNPAISPVEDSKFFLTPL